MFIRYILAWTAVTVVTTMSPRLPAASPLEVTGPSEVSVGERAVLTLNTRPARIPRRYLRLSATGGLLGDLTRGPTGSWSLPFTPPRVARPTTVEVHAAVGHRAPVIHRVDVLPERHHVEERATGGPFNFRLPRAAVLGDDDTLRVSLRVEDPAEVVLVTSVGTIERTGVVDGRLQAVYRPPADRFPQRAIIAALGPGGALDWGALPLIGRPTVETDTTAGASVVVEVAGERFGPSIADHTGRATIAVLVPPGVAEATVHATDEGGAATDEHLALNTPQPPSLVAICNASTVALIALAPDGEPLPGTPRLDADQGRLEPSRPIAPGVHRAGYDMPTGPSRARFSIRAEQGGHSVTCDVTRDAAPVGSADESPRRWLGVSLQGGVHTNFGSIVAPLVTAQLTARLPVLGDGLLVGVAGGLLIHRSEGADRLQGEDVAMTLVGGPLTARVAYELPVPTVVPYVVAHGGLFLVTSRLASDSAGSTATTQAIPTAGGGLGAWVGLGPGQAMLEAGYTYAKLDNDLVDGTLGGLGVTGGYRVEF